MPDTLDAPTLLRRPNRRVVAGVAGGIADHLRIPVSYVRAAFVVASAAGGLGIVIYAGFWIVVPSAAAPNQRSQLSISEYVAAGAIAIVAIASSAWTSPFGNLFIPAAIGCLGAALLWRQAGDTQRARWRQLSRASLSATTDDGHGRARMLVGAVLVVIGCASALAPTDLAALRDGLEAVAITLVGVALITGPWWVRMATELTEERRERIRSQERAAFAAHLHDSVLQTLALIQSNAESPREVVRLARGQERALRSMLYSPTHSDPVGNLADTIRATAAEVEDAYAISVEVVVVGDAPLDDALTELVAATREALVNAARHAGVDTASLYVEVDDTAVVAYVRDRGNGFDPTCVPPDRHGLRGSIVERAQRHGGTATVRSEHGWGTEISIKVPR